MTATTHGTSAPSRARRGANTTLGILSAITLAAIAVQIGLAGLGAFGGSFAAHMTMGYVIGLLTLLILIAALIARPGTTGIWLAVVLFVLAGPVQPLLATLSYGNPWLGALHGLDAAVIFGLTGRIMYEGFRRRPTQP